MELTGATLVGARLTRAEEERILARSRWIEVKQVNTNISYVVSLDVLAIPPAIPSRRFWGLSNNGTASGDRGLKTAGLPLAVWNLDGCRRPVEQELTP